MDISFGTDGWRGIIADDFTFDNVRIVAQAISDYLKNSDSRLTTHDSPLLIVGYDTRFLSDRFAREAACVAAANGIKILLTDSFAPTPAVSYAVVVNNADGAIMITASHNPPRYNGMKFKAPYGGSATPAITGKIEQSLESNFEAGKKPSGVDFDQALKNGSIRLFDPKAPYLKRIEHLLDLKTIREGNVSVVVDPMYGAGQGYLSAILGDNGCHVKEIHNTQDPCFGGLNPEPIGAHIRGLREAVLSEKASIGLALDGDADRVGAIDDKGGFVSSHKIFALLLRYLVNVKGWRGTVVKTVSTTSLIDLLAGELGLELFETPIGFKYICQHMLDGDVLIGGEESGGIGIKGHIPERDGMLIGSLLVEMTAYHKKTLSGLLKELHDEKGAFCYDRIDLETGRNINEELKSYMERPALDIPGPAGVRELKTTDGFKFCFKDGSWLMIRASGTEAVVRIYAEAATMDEVKRLLNEGKSIIEELMQVKD
jgi:alpha-D-glucose phosphate-specific phosphoglucomutase